MTVSSGRGRGLLASCLVAGLLFAGACRDGADDQVATLSETRPPAPVETAEAPAPAPPEPPPVESPQPADATPSEESPPPEPPPPLPPLPEGDLDDAAVAALAASVEAAQSGVTSSLEQVYLTMQLSFAGQSMGSVSDVPYALSTTVGDLTHVMIDQSALSALSAFEDGMAPGGPAEAPPMEMVLDASTQQIYVRLAPLTELGPSEQPPFVAELAAQGEDLSNLWGRPSIDSPDQEFLPGFSPATRPGIGVFLDLLKAASDTASVLEARRVGPSETAGVATQEYTFAIDLAALAGQWPPFLDSFLGGPGGAEPPPPEFLDSFSPLVSDFSLHVDGAGTARQAGFDLDLGAFLMAGLAGFGEAADAPEGAEIDFPEIEYRLAMSVEALAVNDPSLTVSLPDPSQVLDVPFG